MKIIKIVFSSEATLWLLMSFRPSVRLYVCMSVCLSGLGGNAIFSVANWDIAPIFCALINEHLFCKYFIRLSFGNATKGFATYGCFHPCFFLHLWHCYSINGASLRYHVKLKWPKQCPRFLYIHWNIVKRHILYLNTA